MKAENILSSFDPDNVWFTSDTHFCHGNILRFCGRPFGSVDEMDEEMIRRWNAKVPADGVIFHLGDFCYGKCSKWNAILDSLNGRKFLVLGNHDITRLKEPSVGRFEQVSMQMFIDVGGQRIVLNHNPFLCYGGAFRDIWQLFGHVHSGPRSNAGIDIPRLKMLFPRQYDVGVDNNDFTPVSFLEVKEKIEAAVREAKLSGGIDPDEDFTGIRRVVFTGEGIALSSEQVRFLSDNAATVMPLVLKNGETVMEAISWKIGLLGGHTRFAFIGEEELDGIRDVKAEKGKAVSTEMLEKALRILK